MRIRNRLINSTLFNFIAVVFNQGSIFISNIIVARILFKQGFGEYAIVFSTLQAVSTLSQLSSGYTASKYISEYRSSNPQRAGRIMGICGLISVLAAVLGMLLFIIISPWLANSILKVQELAPALMVGSAYIFFTAVNGYQTGSLSGLEAYKSLAKAGVASGTVVLPAIYLGASLGGTTGAVIGLSISAFIRCCIHNSFLRIEIQLHNIKPEYSISFRQENKLVLNFALPAILAGFYSQPLIWLGSYFLAHQPRGYEELAYYSAALNIKSILLFIPLTINGVVSSILNHLRGCKNEKHYAILFRFNVIFLFATTLASAFLIAALSNFFLGLFGKGFAEGKIVLWVLLAAGVLEASATSIYNHIQNTGKLWHSFFIINVPLGLLFVSVAFFLVPLYGAIGLGIANIAMTGFALVVSALLSHRISKHENLVVS